MPNKMAYCRNKELPEKVNQLPGLHNKSHLHFQIFICVAKNTSSGNACKPAVNQNHLRSKQNLKKKKKNLKEFIFY